MLLLHEDNLEKSRRDLFASFGQSGGSQKRIMWDTQVQAVKIESGFFSFCLAWSTLPLFIFWLFIYVSLLGRLVRVLEPIF